MEKAYEKLDNKVCPICRGRGEVLSPDHGECTHYIGSLYEMCYACGGTGLASSKDWVSRRVERVKREF